MPLETASSPRPGHALIFGEVLYDHFPDGSTVLGGAPFNVAWHLQGFGTQPRLISRVGMDAEGERVAATMNAWGMDTSGLQRDAHHPTGTVRVSLNQGQPSFDILADQAYDYIDASEALAVLDTGPAAHPSLLYHGTLALRGETSRRALMRLRAQAGPDALPGFVDINLRPPWWDQAGVEQALLGARWAKLNEDELANMEARTLAREEWVAVAEAWRRRHGLALLVLTLGSEGAWLLGPGLAEFGALVPVAQLVDTVGAGDAFSAVTLFGLMQGWSPARIVSRALAFASRICAQAGATAPNADLYREFLDNWSHDEKTAP